MNFVILKKNYDDEMLIKDFFKSLLGASVRFSDFANYLVCYHRYNDLDDIKRSLNALAVDFSFIPFAYLSNSIYDNEKELNLAIKLLDNLNGGIYDLKSAIISSNNISNKKEIFDFITESSGITEEFIKEFIDNDLNVSKASKVMYLHRNTLIYKLDKFYNDTGFDLRKFKDMYILYSLLENK